MLLGFSMDELVELENLIVFGCNEEFEMLGVFSFVNLLNVQFMFVIKVLGVVDLLDDEFGFIVMEGYVDIVFVWYSIGVFMIFIVSDDVFDNYMVDVVVVVYLYVKMFIFIIDIFDFWMDGIGFVVFVFVFLQCLFNQFL